MNNKKTILASWKKFAEEVAKIDQKSLLSNMKQRTEKSASPSSLIKPAEYLKWCEARKKAIKECENKMIKTGEYTKYTVSDDNTITA